MPRTTNSDYDFSWARAGAVGPVITPDPPPNAAVEVEPLASGTITIPNPGRWELPESNSNRILRRAMEAMPDGSLRTGRGRPRGFEDAPPVDGVRAPATEMWLVKADEDPLQGRKLPTGSSDGTISRRGVLTPCKPPFQGVQELSMRLANSYIVHEGKLWWCGGVDTNSIQLMDEREQTRVVAVSDIRDFRSPSPCYLDLPAQTFNGVLSQRMAAYFSRAPIRVQRHGLSPETSTLTAIDQPLRQRNSLSSRTFHHRTIMVSYNDKSDKVWDNFLERMLQDNFVFSFRLSDVLAVSNSSATPGVVDRGPLKIFYKGRFLCPLVNDTAQLSARDFGAQWILDDLRLVGINAEHNTISDEAKKEKAHG